MKKTLTIILVVVGVVGVLWLTQGWTTRINARIDPRVAKFNADADNLIMGLQQYKEFVGTYPTGNNVAISKALLGQGEKKIIILAVRRAELNDKGEILDPWGTPLEFYFSHNAVMIRSAGPNKVWEDSSAPAPDDLYRCALKEK
jgi:hypothetical protein